MYKADPMAKACMPTYYDTVINSYEYTETMHDTIRIMYNIIYNLPEIYQKSFDIYYNLEKTQLHADPDTGVEMPFTAYVAIYKITGQQIGDQALFFLSNLN